MADFTPRSVLKFSCPDKRGIVAAVAGYIAAQDCNIVESNQYFDPQSARFFMRVAFESSASTSSSTFEGEFKLVAEAYQMDWSIHDLAAKPKVMIMVSKFDHALNDLMYRHSIGQLPMELTSVVSNHQACRKQVEDDGIAYHHLPITADTKSQQEAQLLDLVEQESIELVVLARYMQVLSDKLSTKLSGRVINIHHSFLPSFKGAKPYHRAHARGVKLIGATAHYVTPDLDEGPIIEQDVGRVDHSMTGEQFVESGREIESRVLARAVKAHLEHRILLNGDRTIVFR